MVPFSRAKKQIPSKQRKGAHRPASKLRKRRSPPQEEPVSATGSRGLARYCDLVALFLLMIATLPAVWLSPHTLVVVEHPVLIDHSWILDTSFKASRGLWLGRDVTFTYGPLFQWLSSAPARWTGFSMGAVHSTYNTLPLWCTFLLGYLTLRLLLPEQPAWKHSVLLILLSVFWAASELRSSLPIFLFALFLRGWYALRDGSLSPVVLGCFAAIMCAVACLYSADAGIYSFAAFLISLAGVACEGYREWQALRRYSIALLTFGGSSAVLVIVINAIMATPLDFRFWKNSLAIIAGYRWIEPFPILTGFDGMRLIGPLVVASIIFLVRMVNKSSRNIITARRGFCFGALVFSVVCMQPALVRSDLPHIIIGTFALVFFAGILLFSFESRAASVFAVAFAIACSLFLAQPALVLLPTNIRDRFSNLRGPITACPNGLKEFDRTCYPAAVTDMLQTAAAYLQQHSNPNSSIVIFPFQTLFGMASGRNVAGGVMQSYLVSGTRLSQIDIAGLDRATAPAGLYLPDADLKHATTNDLSLLVDGVANFTRSPEIWLWMVRHYRSDRELVPGVIGLQRDDSRVGRISIHPQPIGVSAQTAPVEEQRTLIDLGSFSWPSQADFLRLRVTVRYSAWWKLRKPARLLLEITRADGSRDVQYFLVQPNVSAEVWFYPWRQPELANYFDADESHWRSSRPPLTRLRLLVTPLDWVSIQPDTVVIEAADAVRITQGTSTISF